MSSAADSSRGLFGRTGMHARAPLRARILAPIVQPLVDRAESNERTGLVDLALICIAGPLLFVFFPINFTRHMCRWFA